MCIKLWQKVLKNKDIFKDFFAKEKKKHFSKTFSVRVENLFSAKDAILDIDNISREMYKITNLKSSLLYLVNP